MKKPQIKFSHRYWKMPKGLDNTVLCFVYKINYTDLPKIFIKYDTEFTDKHGKLEYYKLPNTDLLILGLISEDFDLWTTIRRWTPEKEEYYRGLIGKEVEIVIKEVGLNE